MKKSFFSLSALILIALSFTACKKDEKTFEEQVIGSWHSVKVKVNDNNATNYYEYDLQLEQDKSFDATLRYTPPPPIQEAVKHPKGQWVAIDTDQKLELTYDGTQEVESYEVLELSDTEMMVRIEQSNGDKIEISFEKL